MEQGVQARDGEYAHAARRYEAREMAQGIIGRLPFEATMGSVYQGRRGTVITDVVGAAVGIQRQVPVDPALGPATQVVYQRTSITFGDRPVTSMGPSFLTAFGEDQALVGIGSCTA